MSEKLFKGKAIYQPKPGSKSDEYSGGGFALGLYNGCSGACTYCFNRHCQASKVLGADKPTLKKCLVNEWEARGIFRKEMMKNLPELQKKGLFATFVSDPFLPETKQLFRDCIVDAVAQEINCKMLTKQSGMENETWLTTGKFFIHKHLAIGFTLTGHDELEPGCATNAERIQSMKKLHEMGFKTFASCEPIIDIVKSFEMFTKSFYVSDLFKIGLLKGKLFDKTELNDFVKNVNLISCNIREGRKIYFKDSILKAAGINRADLPANCVQYDYNIWEG